MLTSPPSPVRPFAREQRRRLHVGLSILLAGGIWVGSYALFVFTSILGLRNAFEGSRQLSVLDQVLETGEAANLLAGIVFGLLVLCTLALGTGILAAARWTHWVLGAWLVSIAACTAVVVLSAPPSKWSSYWPALLAWLGFAAGVVWAVRKLGSDRDAAMARAPSDQAAV
jgi:hypothetical protein